MGDGVMGVVGVCVVEWVWVGWYGGWWWGGGGGVGVMV